MQKAGGGTQLLKLPFGVGSAKALFPKGPKDSKVVFVAGSTGRTGFRIVK